MKKIWMISGILLLVAIAVPVWAKGAKTEKVIVPQVGWSGAAQETAWGQGDKSGTSGWAMAIKFTSSYSFKWHPAVAGGNSIIQAPVYAAAGDTAVARGLETGNAWKMAIEYKGKAVTTALVAGQHHDVGTVSVSAPVRGKITVSIAIDPEAAILNPDPSKEAYQFGIYSNLADCKERGKGNYKGELATYELDYAGGTQYVWAHANVLRITGYEDQVIAGGSEATPGYWELLVSEPVTAALVAGQHYIVGEVAITDNLDGTALVEYTLNNSALAIDEVHFGAYARLADIPKGNGKLDGDAATGLVRLPGYIAAPALPTRPPANPDAEFETGVFTYECYIPAHASVIQVQ